MDYPTAIRRWQSSSIVFWKGDDYRIVGFNMAKNMATLMPVGRYLPEEAPLKEITE